MIAYYLEELERLGRSKSHLANERSFLTRLTKACNWQAIASMQPVQPMLPECAAVLEKLCVGMHPTQKVFPSVPIPRTFNRDLRRVGVAKRDERGRQAGFHAPRYFFCTLTGRWLPIQTVRLLMRHRDIRTTCNLYMDLGIEDVAAETSKLPRLLPPVLP
jgi:integrase